MSNVNPDYYACPFCNEVNVGKTCSACRYPNCDPVFFDGPEAPHGNTIIENHSH